MGEEAICGKMACDSVLSALRPSGSVLVLLGVALVASIAAGSLLMIVVSFLLLAVIARHPATRSS
jgi:hypothetical protein